ncbi:MAG: peroxide stress protein YaaA [Bacteroidota bacterium]
MLLIISPAKKLDLSEESRLTEQYSLPAYLEDSLELVGQLKERDEESIGKLMNISPQLSSLNYDRFQEFHTPFKPDNAKQALLTFKGDVYLSFDLEKYEEADFDFAQKHLRILSGLYGLLKPLDLIQAYRLEMGTRLKNQRGKNLYEFWGDIIHKAVQEAMDSTADQTLVNLASNEYFKSVKAKSLNGKVITPQFKDEKNGTFKTLFLYAKQARGAMCDYAIRERITDAEGLKNFTGMGYHYQENLSDENTWVFTR